MGHKKLVGFASAGLLVCATALAILAATWLGGSTASAATADAVIRAAGRPLNQQTWTDGDDSAGLLDMAGATMAVDSGTEDIVAEVSFYPDFSYVNVGAGGDLILLEIDADADAQTGQYLNSWVVGADYLVMLLYSHSEMGWSAYLARTPSDDQATWTMIRVTRATMTTAPSGQVVLSASIHPSDIGDPSHIRFLAGTVYGAAGGQVIEDYLPDYPYVASYVAREESTTSTEETTTTTLPPTTTSTIQPPTTTTTAPDESRFSDVPSSHPYKAQIDDLATREIVGGFDDGTFRPNAPVTRQQFAKMVAKTFALPVSELDICPFGDVPTSMASPDPLYPDHYVAVCAARQITLGKSPTSFAPFANISRAQLLTMVSRAASLAEPPADYMPPFPQFDTTHYPFARRAAYAGLLDGLQGIGPTFAFTAQATRGEVCVLLHNVLHR